MAEARRTRRTIALVGNAVALALIGSLLLSGPRLFGSPPAPAAASVAVADIAPDGPALLLVVLDALRADTARDADAMPTLASLADGGVRTTWWVDLLVPSTVGALERLVEGRAPPAVAALRDFGASPAVHGGWLERISDAGGETFVAGPDLWTERYGAWITDAHVEAGLPNAVSDVRVAGAARRALAGAAPRVVVAHFGELDSVAHRHGAAGAEWRAAARRVDARLADVLDAVADERRIVVLADHGVTRRGGHAGGERVVRDAPLVVANARPVEPVAGRLDPTRLVDAVLSGADDPVLAAAVAAVPGAPSSAARVAVGAAVVAGAAIAVCGARALATGGVPGFALSASLWIAVALAASGRVGVGAALIAASVWLAAALAIHRAAPLPPGSRTVSRRASRPSPPPVRRLARPSPGWPLVAFVIGACVALAGVAIAVRGADRALAAAVPFGAVAAVVGAGVGFAIGRRPSAPAAGCALAAGIALAVHAGGETLSLSSVDVGLAHRVAALAPGPEGIALAAPLALLRLVLPVVAVLAGVALGRRHRRAGDRAGADIERRDERAFAFAASFAFCLLGAAVVHAACLARAVDPATAYALPLAAAGLGGLLRDAVTGALVFVALALRGAGARASRRRAL